MVPHRALVLQPYPWPYRPAIHGPYIYAALRSISGLFTEVPPCWHRRYRDGPSGDAERGRLYEGNRTLRSISYLRQHDRQCVSVNVFLSGPY